MYVGLLCSFKSHYDVCRAQQHFTLRYRDMLLEQEKLDRGRTEAAFFQFAVLRVASRYPDLFQVSNLPPHNSLPDTLTKVAKDYCGAFMDIYASTYIYNVLHTCMFVCKCTHQYMSKVTNRIILI